MRAPKEDEVGQASADDPWRHLDAADPRLVSLTRIMITSVPWSRSSPFRRFEHLDTVHLVVDRGRVEASAGSRHLFGPFPRIAAACLMDRPTLKRSTVRTRVRQRRIPRLRGNRTTMAPTTEPAQQTTAYMLDLVHRHHTSPRPAPGRDDPIDPVTKIAQLGELAVGTILSARIGSGLLFHHFAVADDHVDSAQVVAQRLHVGVHLRHRGGLIRSEPVTATTVPTNRTFSIRRDWSGRSRITCSTMIS